MLANSKNTPNFSFLYIPKNAIIQGLVFSSQFYLDSMQYGNTITQNKRMFPLKSFTIGLFRVCKYPFI